ncbi:hypothetical protein diail_7213 [Diaporthe ilicicola]|nr:hypothetical protein diail_7213 [Diaporthe ilicicola]
MASPALDSIKRATGISSLDLTEMKAQTTWSGGDIQDGSKDPAATRFRLKIDTDIQQVNREAAHVFCFKLTARIAIVHNDRQKASTPTMVEQQRRMSKHELFRELAFVGDSEHMRNRPDWPVYLLDSMRHKDSAGDVIKDLKKLLALSASRRQDTTNPSQSHWGLQNFIEAHVGEDTIGDAVLKMVRHLKVEWLQHSGLTLLKDMPIGSSHFGSEPSETGLMDASEAFSAVVIDTVLYFQLDE